MSDPVQRDRIWLRAGRLFVRDGWLVTESGERTHIANGELKITDGWLVLNGPTPPESTREAPPYSGPERRRQERRRP